MGIEAVIFDLGETLLNYDAPDIDELFRQGGRLTYDYLRQTTGQRLCSFGRYYRRHSLSIKWHCLWSNVTGREFNCLALLGRQARHMGVRLSAEQLDELAWLWYEPLGRTVSIEPELHSRLEELGRMSLKLAIISNTFLPAVVLDNHLRQLDLLRFFPVRLYSSTTVFRKPDRRIYLHALQELNVSADRAVMVGDKLREDIKGAARAGIRPVFKRGRANHSVRLGDGIRSIDSIAELPGLIDGWHR